MNRRSFLSTLGMAGLAAGGCKYWPDDDIWNACSRDVLPPHLAHRELVQAAWEGIDPNYFWDVHIHLLGVGDGASGIWPNRFKWIASIHPYRPDAIEALKRVRSLGVREQSNGCHRRWV